MTAKLISIPGSFRDPAGFLFYRDGSLYRQVQPVYADNYQQLFDSGLYDELSSSSKLIEHSEVSLDLSYKLGAWKILKPALVPMLSWPYEWCFSQLKDAALLTLDIQLQALKRDMSLRDASAYNIQFLEGKPVFIDTLSFEKYKLGEGWKPYGQFCQHFLAPLALMSYCDIRLGQLLRVHIDGIPLDLASSLMPFKSRLSLGLLLHLHLHGRSQQYHSKKRDIKVHNTPSIPKKRLVAMLTQLRDTVQHFNWAPNGTEWIDYYEANNNYGELGINSKEHAVEQLVEKIKPSTVWDLGGNTGRFSRIAAKSAAQVVTWDVDPACVEANYRIVRRNSECRILPLLLDLSNPSPRLGWASSEREGILERGRCSLLLALGLVHHLAIGQNVPMERIAAYFHELADSLIVEFIPKSDSQVLKMLSSRQDIFPAYSVEGFEAAFKEYWVIDQRIDINHTQRIIYLMTQK